MSKTLTITLTQPQVLLLRSMTMFSTTKRLIQKVQLFASSKDPVSEVRALNSLDVEVADHTSFHTALLSIVQRAVSTKEPVVVELPLDRYQWLMEVVHLPDLDSQAPNIVKALRSEADHVEYIKQIKELRQIVAEALPSEDATWAPTSGQKYVQ